MPVKMDDPDRWRNYLEARALPGLELSEITKPGGFLPSKVRKGARVKTTLESSCRFHVVRLVRWKPTFGGCGS